MTDLWCWVDFGVIGFFKAVLATIALLVVLFMLESSWLQLKKMWREARE